MASGHVNRANRPNTWLHRPSLRREDSSCQLGAVHTWHKADIARLSSDVRFLGVKRTLHFRIPMSAFDPKRTFAVRDYKATEAGYLRFFEHSLNRRGRARPRDNQSLQLNPTLRRLTGLRQSRA